MNNGTTWRQFDGKCFGTFAVKASSFLRITNRQVSQDHPWQDHPRQPGRDTNSYLHPGLDFFFFFKETIQGTAGCSTSWWKLLSSSQTCCFISAQE